MINHEKAGQIAKRYGGQYSADSGTLTIPKEVFDKGQDVNGIFTALLMQGITGDGGFFNTVKMEATDVEVEEDSVSLVLK